MSKYRARFEVIVDVTIDDDNTEIEGPIGLQGNSEKIAINRALWWLLRQDIPRHSRAMFEELQPLRKKLGVGLILVPNNERSHKAERVDESQTDS